MCYKILFVSGIRSDYDLLKPLAQAMNISSDFTVSFHLCAPHFSSAHNFSYNLVLQDGFNVVNKERNFKTKFYKSTTQRVDVIGETISEINKTLEIVQPHLVIYLGDREEPLAAAIACVYNNIPAVHIAGGDNCFPEGGDVDEPVRHAISKLSSLHLVMAEPHKKRLINMGEPHDRIKVVGNAGLDSIATTPYLDIANFKNLPIDKLQRNYAVVIYHVMSSYTPEQALFEFDNILNSLRTNQVLAFIGAPNSDPGQQIITSHVNQFIKTNSEDAIFYKNLPRLEFINMLRNCEFIIGNSSLGILESQFLNKPAINVGQRQVGRLHGSNVLFCDGQLDTINNAIDNVRTSIFMDAVKASVSIYGDGNMAEQSVRFILDQIKRPDLLAKHITY
jgi:GDP/UDP-N,N'-diacetylbacillosamine 2-epimerase (hydrolysing)